ncbi:MAG TPA: hypothetical protein VML55_11315 [Planctomycetaceae bacterium]|nr:hypothetical protein [Planctomycetaceae bacterium]
MIEGIVTDEGVPQIRMPIAGREWRTVVRVEATFVADDQILLGTRMLRKHRLESDFPAQTVRLERRTGS